MKKIFVLISMFAFCIASSAATAVKYASWNIGHFALGKCWTSNIAESDAGAKSDEYRAFLDKVGADLIGVAEYSESFACVGLVKNAGFTTFDLAPSGESSAKAVFARYGRNAAGPRNGYQWNAFFWNGDKAKETYVRDYRKRNQGVYYLATRLEIGGADVLFVATHLDWNTFAAGHEDDRADQMRQLIEDLKDEPRVVISGDFNVGLRTADGKIDADNPREYEIFEQAGYTLGNKNNLKTCPAGELASANAKALDNIIVKGVAVRDFEVVDCPELSDHALVSATIEVDDPADAGSAGVELAAPFGDNMVLQRLRPVPVWGFAAAGEKVTVTFAGQIKTAVAGADGRWRVDLDPMDASKEGRVLAARGERGASFARNVLVGEVWFASGQSNMECPIWGGGPRYRDGKGAMMIMSTIRPYIRWIKNRKAWSVEPAKIERAPWRDFSPESFAVPPNGHLSAVAYYYALELYGALEIPVGIVDSSWGGTNIDAWTPRCGYEGHPELEDVANFPVTADWKDEMKKGVIYAAQQQPTVIWNGMVDAWTPMAMRGFIWYQGCNNAWEAGRYCDKMHALYDGWSKAFENPGLRIYFAQLAPWKSSWFELQRAQRKFASEEENAAMAVTCDAGNMDDIHPNDKEIVAKRLALHALRRDYGFESVRDDSPALKGWKVENNAFVLSFDNAKEWYVYSPDRSVVPNFEIAGEDGEFKSAKLLNVDESGKVQGEELRVAAEGVAKPVQLRYLFQPPYAGTVYNDVALPLGPFDLDTCAE